MNPWYALSPTQKRQFAPVLSTQHPVLCTMHGKMQRAVCKSQTKLPVPQKSTLRFQNLTADTCGKATQQPCLYFAYCEYIGTNATKMQTSLVEQIEAIISQ